MVLVGFFGFIYKVYQVLEYFYEYFIISGYRYFKSIFFQCIFSVFDVINEIFNFWIYFLFFWYFFWILCDFSDTLDFKYDSYIWLLFIYMFVCIIFFLVSVIVYIFNIMLDLVRYICFFMDYGVLSIFSFGVVIVYRVYCFFSDLRNIWFGYYYIDMVLINSVICIIVFC